nr:hypothetical protein [Dasychira pudibunda nucleopolyhedrovirus]
MTGAQFVFCLYRMLHRSTTSHMYLALATIPLFECGRSRTACSIFSGASATTLLFGCERSRTACAIFGGASATTVLFGCERC